MSKFFVVSEEELTERDQAREEQRHCGEFGFPFDETRLEKAEAACRAREVPEVVANKIGSGLLEKLLAVVEAARECTEGSDYEFTFKLQDALAALEEQG